MLFVEVKQNHRQKMLKVKKYIYSANANVI